MTITPAQTQNTTPIQHGSRLTRFLSGAGLNVLLVTVSGVLASFAFPPHEVWWLVWVSLLPLLIALRRTVAVRAAGWLMLWFGIVYLATSLTWLASIFSVGVIGVYTLATLPWVLFGLAYRSASGRWQGLLPALLAPVLFLAAEWLRCEGWYFQFSWGQLGYVFASCRRLDVLYPLIGVYGATFLVVLVNALLAEIVTARAALQRKALYLLPLGAAVLMLSLAMNQPIGSTTDLRDADRLFRVGIIQDESGVLESTKQQTLAIASAKPRLVVWPEYAVMDYPLSKLRILNGLQNLARQLHCTLVFGCKEHAAADTRVDVLRRRGMMLMEGSLFYNTALIIGPDGSILGTYHKTHPIQFFSDGVPGRAFPSFATPVGRIGIAICYDFDYASTTVRLVHNGAELLAVPTYDATDWTELQQRQHARMAQTRAAESARWVLRATSSGVSQVINPNGQVVAFLTSKLSAYAISSAAPRAELTPYIRYTYRLPMLCVWLSGLWLVWVIGQAVAAFVHFRRE